MPRRRNERGYVKKVGKIVKMWEGYFHIYVTQLDGTEKRRDKARIIGSCDEITKREAEDKLREIILKERGVTRAVVPPVHPSAFPANATFSDVWLRFRSLKEFMWSTATRKAVVSVFETATPKEGQKQKPRRPSVLDMIGSLRVIELTRDPLQQMLQHGGCRILVFLRKESPHLLQRPSITHSMSV